MRVRFTDTALAEIDELLSYIARDNLRAASDVAAQIQKTVSLVAERPSIARVVRRDASGDIHAVIVGRVQVSNFLCRQDRRTDRP